jgi:hypothetical protein
MNKSMPNSNANISISDFKEFYLEQSKPRSIRRLHKLLKNKFPQRKIISLATIFRHSQSEKWKEQTVNLDSRISEKLMEKNVNKKVKEYDNLAQQLELTSTKAMQSVLDAFSKGIGDEIKRPEQILSLVKASVESHKLLNTINGLPSSISGHISYDPSNVEALKNHIQELYASINMDLMKRQKQKDLVQEEIEYRNKKLN